MTFPSGKKNILITGGAGFIGSHLCDKLVSDNHVICIDNFITGSLKNIEHLLQNDNFKFIKHDMTEEFNWEKYPELKEFKVDLQGVNEVYNLACPTSPREYNKIPIETLRANSYGTYNALELARKYKATFLHFSTSSIYGEVDEDYVREDNWGKVNPVGPRSCYNEGKRFAESMVSNYNSKLGVSTKIARVFNTYGPRMRLDDGRMIPDFIVNALSGKPINIFGSPEELGSYCYIQDMIDGLIALMASDVSSPVNLGSDQPEPIIDVAKKVKEITGSESEIEFRDHLPFTARQPIPNIALAKENLNWFPMVSLEEGLEKTVENMKVHLSEHLGEIDMITG